MGVVCCVGVVAVRVPLVVGVVAVTAAVPLKVLVGALGGTALDVGLVADKDPGKETADCGRGLGLATVGLCCKK